ncbi:coil containing protein [Vibrio phage 1.063.O._10N.261.45.C7]|nr:coil containing protein [Vibrio phage 1.063.O._10N.261.45.C7]
MNKEVKLKHTDILSHLVLGDHETAMKIAETELWNDGDGVLEMDIKVNGITLDTEVFRKVMENMWQQARKQAADEVDESQYRDRVEAKAKEILKNQSDNVLEALHDLQGKITYTDNLIKFEWEK